MIELTQDDLEINEYIVKNNDTSKEYYYSKFQEAYECLLEERKHSDKWSLYVELITKEDSKRGEARFVKGIEIPSSFDWLEINEQFEEALDIIFNRGENLMLLGRAGSGKSEFLNLCRTLDPSSVVLAPTGIASTNISGQTIHSFFKFPPEVLVPEKLNLNQELKEKIRSVKRMFVDEISMCRSDMFESLDFICKRARGDFETPFGGIQVILIGDVYQIPPVLKRGEEANYIQDNYEGIFFFNTFAFKNGEFNLLEFSKIYRQKDEIFSSTLTRIREGIHTKEDLDYLNTRCMPESDYIEEINDRYIHLSCLNRDVDRINKTWLDLIEEEEHTYTAVITGKAKASNFQEPEVLTLKKGASIILTQNQVDGFWMNGDMGVVEGFGNTEEHEPYIKVKINRTGMIYRIMRITREQIEYKYGLNAKTNTKELTKEIVGSLHQFPIKLAFSISVHKSQGQSFSKCYLDIGRNWEYGQTYVALSRVRSMEGLGLKKPLTDKDIKVNPEVKAFVEEIRKTQTLDNLH